jgi:hypothetical protein
VKRFLTWLCPEVTFSSLMPWGLSWVRGSSVSEWRWRGRVRYYIHRHLMLQVPLLPWFCTMQARCQLRSERGFKLIYARLSVGTELRRLIVTVELDAKPIGRQRVSGPKWMHA